jgi:MFS family permease
VRHDAATPRRTYALIAAVALLMAAVMLCWDGVLDGDVYLQLASGRFIARHGLVATDPFPTVAHGDPWLNEQWLTELIFYGAARVVGITGLTVIYALLLGAPLALLLWMCRRKGTVMMIALAALYGPGAWMVLHPRAAGFTVLAFSALVVLIAGAWLTSTREGNGLTRARWVLPGALALFALWANLHGGFVAGLLLIALVVVGLVIDRWRNHPTAVDRRQLMILALIGVLAIVTVTLTTPLGDGIWSYLLSFRKPEIARISSEWQPALERPRAVLYLGLAALFAFWLWWRTPAPRALTPLLVSLGFLSFAVVSVRNLVFVAPAIGLQIACSAQARSRPRPRVLVALAVAGTVVAGLMWFGTQAPPQNARPLGSPVLTYAVRHPPREGRIASYAGVGSYLLWRSPRTRVVLDGWLEHFSQSELRDTYSLLNGRSPHPTRDVRRLRIGAVIADRPGAIQILKRLGFVELFASHEGTYLVRRAASGRPMLARGNVPERHTASAAKTS